MGPEVDKEKEMQDAFAAFDRNGDGTLSLDELRVAMAKIGERLTEEELAEMFKEGDLNKDGTIDYFG